MERLIVGTCALPRLELYKQNLHVFVNLLRELDSIDIYWLINIDHPEWINKITKSNKSDVVNFITNLCEGTDIKVVYFHEHKTLGFRNGIERIVKYIDTNDLFTDKTGYMYFEDDMLPNELKVETLKDIVKPNPYKKIVYLGYSNSHPGYFGPHILGKVIFDLIIGEYNRIDEYKTQNAEYVFCNLLLKHIINNNNRFLSILLFDDSEHTNAFKLIRRLPAFTIKKLMKTVDTLPEIQKQFDTSYTAVYQTNSGNTPNCDSFDNDKGYSFIYMRYMNDNNFKDLGRDWKYIHRKATGGTHSQIWDMEIYF